jgi:nucleotide-binding universal stress UspA family protein
LPVLLIVTFRPEFQLPWTGQPQVTMLALNRLDRHDRTALATQIAGDKALPDEVIDQIVDRTDGVPLFVEELTKSVLESGLLREDRDRYVLDGALPPFAIPTTLHASLLARLDRLASVRLVAQIGAAIGREFSYALLRAVSRLPEDELQASLARLVASELVFQRGMPPDADPIQLGGAMGISDILVYVDPTASSAERLDIAFRLAHRFEAYLIGVVPEDAAAVGERLEKMLLNEAILGKWHMAIGLTEPFVTRWAHCADLVILGQRIPDHDTGLYRPEDVILSCSRPVLVVPYAGRRPDRLGDNVLVAWNGSREAGRAVQEALPLMSTSSVVTVLLVDPEDDADIDLAEDLVAHLGRHGLHAKTQVIRYDLATLAVSDTILTQVSELDADLLVMGAYSHSRFREIILGGVTRDILRDMNVPVLMAH